MLSLETDGLIIRRFRPEDWPDLYEYLSRPEVLRYEPERESSIEECQRKALERSKGAAFWAVCLKDGGKDSGNDSGSDSRSDSGSDSGKIIGHVYFSQTRPREFKTWELGYIFNPAYGGKGYATEACRRILQYGFEELGAHRVTAECNPENVPSWRLLERLAMRREAHLKKPAFFRRAEDGRPLWFDAYQYAMLDEEWRTQGGRSS